MSSANISFRNSRVHQAPLWLALLFLFVGQGAFAQLELLAPEHPQSVFGGGERRLRISLRNATDGTAEASLHARLFQLSSATAMPVGGDVPWKKVTVLKGQTVVETAPLPFPTVRGPTRFTVRWLDEADKTIGQTPVTVYPTNLLQQLADIAGEEPFAVFDPQERLTSLLKPLKVEFIDLAEGERAETFRGRFAIAGPFDIQQPLTRDWRKRMLALAGRGVAVVLIAPPARAAHVPNASVLLLNGRLASIAPAAVASLDTDPSAQETLLQCVRLALNPNLSIETEP